jgi:purine-binding chemotaxis protein CheW
MPWRRRLATKDLRLKPVRKQPPVGAETQRSALTAVQRDAVFARRAEALAESPPVDAHDDDTLDALIFTMGGEQYALPANQVHEVRPLGWLTSLPGTPAFLAGLINVRGRIVPVIDLRSLLGMPSADGETRSVALVSYRTGDVGLLVTGRPTVRPVRLAELTEPPPGQLPGIDPACVRGITPGLVIVLDAERLLADPRLVVQHELFSKA